MAASVSEAGTAQARRAARLSVEMASGKRERERERGGKVDEGGGVFFFFLSETKRYKLKEYSPLFSPLLFLSEERGGTLRPYNRYQIINNSVLRDLDDYKFMDFVVRIERLILTGRLSFFRDLIRRCSSHAAEENNQIIL